MKPIQITDDKYTFCRAPEWTKSHQHTISGWTVDEQKKKMHHCGYLNFSVLTNLHTNNPPYH
jgi:hypothetical protein